MQYTIHDSATSRFLFLSLEPQYPKYAMCYFLVTGNYQMFYIKVEPLLNFFRFTELISSAFGSTFENTNQSFTLCCLS